MRPNGDYRIFNGGGWNNYACARFLEVWTQDTLGIPKVPEGYLVLGAPADSDRPYGWRFALVRILPRIKDEEGLDDGPDGQPDAWVTSSSGVEGEVVKAWLVEQQNDLCSAWLMERLRAELDKLKGKNETDRSGTE